ncbi:hypothetical protein [Streptomyces sp. NWU339]|uniref:hypothetical protein n=1 Tax=Streptomyces sp. NWU339 TaxID=2185284 RepID=UPI0015E81BF5|nr:hypothetical protein [Streptomyces sp. NWU339]
MRQVVVTAVATGLLAACGSGGTTGESGSDSPSPEVSASPKPSVKAPEGFDTSKGWSASLDWLPEERDARVASFPPVEAAPQAGVVALLQRKDKGYVVEARDAATGTLRWSSAVWQPPAPADSGGEVSLPRLLVVDQDGREYVTLWAYGEDEADPDEAASGNRVSPVDPSDDGASDDTESGTISLAFYAADSSGKDVAPARTVAIPASAGATSLKVGDGGNGAVVAWDRPGSVNSDSASIDISADRVQTYEKRQVELPPVCVNEGWENCIGGKVAGLSPDGPLMSLHIGGFGVAGSWLSRDAIPPGVNPHNADKAGSVLEVVGNHVISSWGTVKGPAVTAVHGLKSGKLELSAACSTVDGPEYIPVRTAASPNGRYIVKGTLAFDFERDQAYCLDGESAGIRLLSVGDDGVAHGYRQSSGTSGYAPVSFSLETGEVQALPEGTEVPFLALQGVGGFVLPADGPGRQLVFHPRR